MVVLFSHGSNLCMGRMGRPGIDKDVMVEKNGVKRTI